MPSIVCQCDACRGTGLYVGFAEPKGMAVICLGCDGQGWREFAYTAFAGRKRRAGIKAIGRSAGSFLATGVGAVGKAMSYAEFERARPVKLPKAAKA